MSEFKKRIKNKKLLSKTKKKRYNHKYILLADLLLAEFLEIIVIFLAYYTNDTKLIAINLINKEVL
ncbi:hypothetical protein DESAMIL20_1083 [Desulfurella amilsii]|uniref:Uncharacterized protein n=1 Tax=Desulfurella amilsii TaxID=1562698 RepID=A0A1X4XVH6_9BACT|nr:hypothetical protein [Desulfurella amilsii]OSS41530.1 hypothetical protein DESAMIL20_1083 [Desulfurella amilsii]